MANNKGRFSLLIMLFILFGIYCFIFGESGWLERMKLIKSKEQINERINRLEDENRELTELYKRYESGSSLKEEAVKAGYINEGEKLLFFKGIEVEVKKSNNRLDKNEGYNIDIDHFRILWIVISTMAILFYFSRRSREKYKSKLDLN